MTLLPSPGKLSYDHLLKDPKVHPVQIAGVGDRAVEHSDAHTDAIYFTTPGQLPHP